MFNDGLILARGEDGWRLTGVITAREASHGKDMTLVTSGIGRYIASWSSKFGMPFPYKMWSSEFGVLCEKSKALRNTLPF